MVQTFAGLHWARMVDENLRLQHQEINQSGFSNHLVQARCFRNPAKNHQLIHFLVVYLLRGSGYLVTGYM